MSGHAADFQAMLERIGAPLAEGIAQYCAASPEMCDLVLASDGHLALVTLLHASHGSTTVRQALMALNLLVRHADGAVPKTVDAGAARPIVSLLKTSASDASDVDLAFEALSLAKKLASDPGGVAALQKAGAVAPLVSMLAESSVIAVHAASVLASLSGGPDTGGCPIGAWVIQAGAIPLLVALLRGHSPRAAACLLRNLAREVAGAAALYSAGCVVPLAALLNTSDASTVLFAADALLSVADLDERYAAVVLSAIASDPPPPPRSPLRTPPRDGATFHLYSYLWRAALLGLNAAMDGKDETGLNVAIAQAEMVLVPEPDLRRARAMFDQLAAQRLRRATLGIGELQPPEEFICPITLELMVHPVCASDGHSYERVAIERVLAGPAPTRVSPMSREPLQPFLFPNYALKCRIAAHEPELLALAETAVASAEARHAGPSPRKRSRVSL